jgi:NAD(P)-dependent dehydrogenase (short-subunit alcohol dehydrogenase family)
MRNLAEQAMAQGEFDAVIHNVGLGYREPRRVETVDGLSQLWALNVLAPFVLTCLMPIPARLIYLTSGMHLGGDPGLVDVQWAVRRWNGAQAYSDTKLHDLLLAFGFARRWPSVRVNAVSPGWVATRMGGAGATDDLDQGHRTQAWLAVGDDATGSGELYYHHKPAKVAPSARDAARQDAMLDYCQTAAGIALP